MSLCEHNEFIAGNVHTDFIPQHRNQLFHSEKQSLIDSNVICSSICSILNYETESYLNLKLFDPFIAKLSQNSWTNATKQRKIGVLFNNENKCIK